MHGTNSRKGVNIQVTRFISCNARYPPWVVRDLLQHKRVLRVSIQARFSEHCLRCCRREGRNSSAVSTDDCAIESGSEIRAGWQ
jgi:hypothetical protein